jgi:hypothetical protein
MVAICIVIIFLQLFVFPFVVSFEGHVSAFDNDGFIRVKLFRFITVYKTQAFVKHIDAIHNDLILKNKGKENFYHINADKSDEKSISRLLDVKFIPQVNFESLDLVAAVGKRDDAVFTTIALSVIRASVCAFIAKLKSVQKVAVTNEFIPEFNKDIFSLRFSGIIDLSFADIIYGYISTKRSKK